MTVIIVVIVAAVFVFRNMRPQKLNMARLWILPGVLVLLSVVVLASSALAGAEAPGMVAPPLWEIALAAIIGIVLGIPLGLARGHASKVRLGDRKGVLIVEPSIMVMLIWLVAFAVKFGLKSLMPQAGAAVFAVSDGFLLFAISSVVTMRFVLYQKFKALNVTSAEIVEG